MFRKYLSLCLILLLAGFTMLSAQDMRTVRGLVSDENGQYIGGATLKADGVDTPFKAGRTGQFTIKVPFSCRTITALVDGYAPVTLDASAGFLLFQMKPQTQAGASAQAKADQAAAAIALAKAQQAKAEAEKQAQAQAQAQAKAKEQQAQEAAKAEKEALAQKQKEQEAKEKPKQESKPQEVKPASKFKSQGLIQSIDFSYAYQFYSGTIVYANSGLRKYSVQHPLQATYSIGWRFNYMFALMAGAGFQYNLFSLERPGDKPDPDLYGNVKILRYDVPVFLNFRCYFTDTPVQPYLTVSGGIYTLSFIDALERKLPAAQMPLLMDLGLGVAFRLGGSAAINLAVSARTTPWPEFTQTGFNGYPILRIVPAATVGISF